MARERSMSLRTSLLLYTLGPIILFCELSLQHPLSYVTIKLPHSQFPAFFHSLKTPSPLLPLIHRRFVESSFNKLDREQNSAFLQLFIQPYLNFRCTFVKFWD